MVNRRSRDFLFHIETEAQFESVKPLLIYLRETKKTTFDVVVPNAVSEQTVKDNSILEGCANALKREKFKVIRGIDGAVLPDKIIATNYKILLSAYMQPWHYENLDVKYRIMFPYASYYLNKPNWTIEQFIKQDYLADALLSHAVGTKPITDVFTKTHIVPSLKLMGYHKKTKKSGKPVLFFAPTYNEVDFAVNFLHNISEIKKEYIVIMRSHHKTSYANDSNELFENLYEAADRIYDVNEYPLTTPLEEADIVISDNSAIIFDAIYCGIPVSLFSRDSNSFSYRDINTAQYKLVEAGDILWTNEPAMIKSNVEKTLSAEMVDKQKRMRKALFPYAIDNPVEQWMEVLNMYLNDSIPSEYQLAKKYWIENINHYKSESISLATDVDKLNQQINDRDSQLILEQNPGIVTSLKRLVKAIIRKYYTNPKRHIKYILRLPYRKFRIKFLKDPIIIYQFVFTEPDSINFGDELTKDILERVFHRKVEVHNQIDTRFDMLGVGSLIHFFNDIVDYKTYVWGSGLIDDKITVLNNNFIFKACRGKLTRAWVAKKYKKIPLGDPGLLSNLIYTNDIKKTDKIGVIPHLRDESSNFLNDIIKTHPEIFKIIPVAQSPEEVADQIKSCKLILSSSLHGLIVSDSLGVPNIHLMLSDNLKSENYLRGGEHKFRDYYSGVGRRYDNFNPRFKNLLDTKEYDLIIKRYKPLDNLREIQKALIKSFPYR